MSRSPKSSKRNAPPVADIEVRAFGWRFLMLFERHRPSVDAPDVVSNHGGQFEMPPGFGFGDSVCSEVSIVHGRVTNKSNCA